MTPTVSVIMIFLDPGPHFQEAVASVLAQTLPDVELLLIDDGSTDGSSDLARAWAAEHAPRVRYVEHAGHANLGMSAARNAGLAAVTGALVAFLDADDVWLPEHLEHAVALLRDSGATWLTGTSVTWHSWLAGGVDDPRPLAAAPGTVLPPPEHLVARLRHGDLTPVPGALLAPRALLEQVGGAEPAFRTLYEDQVLLAKLELVAPVILNGRRTVLYRQHPSSSTARDRDGRLDARRAFLAWLSAEQAVRDDARLLDIVSEQQSELDAPPRTGPRRPVPALMRRLVRRPVPDGVEAAVLLLEAQRGTVGGEEVATQLLRTALAEATADLAGRVLEVGDAAGTVAAGKWAQRCEVVTVKSVPSSGRFDVVLAARPFTVGGPPAVDVLSALVERLEPGGVLHLVVDALPGYDWAASPAVVAELVERVLPTDHFVVQGRGTPGAAAAAVLALPAATLGRLTPHPSSRAYPVVTVLRAFRPRERTWA